MDELTIQEKSDLLLDAQGWYRRAYATGDICGMSRSEIHLTTDAFPKYATDPSKWELVDRRTDALPYEIHYHLETPNGMVLLFCVLGTNELHRLVMAFGLDYKTKAVSYHCHL